MTMTCRRRMQGDMEDSCGELLKRREVELDFRRNLFFYYCVCSTGMCRLDLAWIMTFSHGS